MLLVLIVLISMPFTQGYTPVNFNETDDPVFSNTRTFASSSTLTHPEGFAENYVLYVQSHLLADEIWLEPYYKVDMNNDGTWDSGNYWCLNDRKVSFDYPEVAIGETGSATIRVKVRHLEDNEYVYEDFYFNVVTLHTPEISYSTADGDLITTFISADGVMDKPLVIVEGFDVFNSTWPSYYYYSFMDMITNYLSPAGYDVSFVNFADGSTLLQNNAMVLLGALNMIAGNNYTNPSRVMGLSMGGVIARYALAFAEDPANAIDHGCNMFISYDSPQQGGYISTALQDFFGGIDNDDIDNPMVSIIQEQLQSPAAKQMLRYNYYDPASSGDLTKITVSSSIDGGPMYEAFYTELNALNGDGYPDQAYNIGISNGQGNVSNHTMESVWPEGYEDHGFVQLEVVGLPLETIGFSLTDIIPGSYLPAFRDEGSIPGSITMFAGMDFPWPISKYDVDPVALDYMVTTGDAPCYIWAQSALDLVNPDYGDDPSTYANIESWDYSMFDEIYAQSDQSYYHDVISEQTMSYVLNQLLNPNPISVTFKNVADDGSELDGYLSVSDYYTQITSGAVKSVPGFTPLTVFTNQQNLSNNEDELLQHHHWNDDEGELLISHSKIFFPNVVDKAIFKNVEDVTLSDNIQGYNVDFWFKDPWYVENPEDDLEDWAQPDDYRTISSGDFDVFLDQNEKFLDGIPIYSLKAPRIHQESDKWYLFKQWSGSNVDFGGGATTTTELETPVVFSAGAEVEAEYDVVTITDPDVKITHSNGEYHLDAPSHTATTNMIYRFYNWEVTNMIIAASQQEETVITSISGNATAYPAYSAVDFDGDVLKLSEHLTIPAGAHYEFGPEFAFTVMNIGDLHLNGTVTDPVILSSVDDEGWLGIDLSEFSTVTAQYCVIENAAMALDIEGSYWDMDHMVFYDNEVAVTITDNVLQEWGSINNSIFSNNNTSVVLVNCEPPNNDIDIDYSLFYNSSIPGDLNSTNMTNLSPQFTSAASGDFTLKHTSPGIDAGDPNSAYDPDGTRADIGAYYYQIPTPVLSISGSVGENPTLSWTVGGITNYDQGEVWRYYDTIESDGRLMATVSGYSWTDTDYEITLADGGTANPLGVIGEEGMIGEDPIDNTETLKVKYRVKVCDTNNHLSPYSNEKYTYRLVESGYSPLKQLVALIPSEFALHQNYPNPFNPTTTVKYDLPEESQVTIVIYDFLGREVRTLVDGTIEAGYNHIVWDGKTDAGRPAATGMYILVFKARGLDNGERIQSNMKLILIK